MSENKKDEMDCYELLTMELDRETENYLKQNGLSWILKRRKEFQEFLKRWKEDENDTHVHSC